METDLTDMEASSVSKLNTKFEDNVTIRKMIKIHEYTTKLVCIH